MIYDETMMNFFLLAMEAVTLKRLRDNQVIAFAINGPWLHFDYIFLPFEADKKNIWIICIAIGTGDHITPKYLGNFDYFQLIGCLTLTSSTVSSN